MNHFRKDGLLLLLIQVSLLLTVPYYIVRGISGATYGRGLADWLLYLGLACQPLSFSILFSKIAQCTYNEYLFLIAAMATSCLLGVVRLAMKKCAENIQKWWYGFLCIFFIADAVFALAGCVFCMQKLQVPLLILGIAFRGVCAYLAGQECRSKSIIKQ